MPEPKLGIDTETKQNVIQFSASDRSWGLELTTNPALPLMSGKCFRLTDDSGKVVAEIPFSQTTYLYSRIATITGCGYDTAKKLAERLVF